MGTELKPCPFCGGEAQPEVIRWGEVVNASVYCPHCGLGIHRNELNGGINAAIAAWNTRHVETCRMEPLNAFYTDLNGLNQTEWGVCSNCGTASPIDATYCCECGRKVER